MRCFMCPRRCGADRDAGQPGVCGVCGTGVPVDTGGSVGSVGGIRVARAGVHMWEEPCISGTRGSGTVFFSGCNLGCVFCQNREISRGGVGKNIDIKRLCKIFSELKAQGVHNINLVTPSHYITAVARALEHSPGLPVVFNTSAYDSVEALKLLEGKIDIYLPDMKYSSPEAAKRYSHAADYPAVAKEAISEMYRQVGAPRFDDDGILVRGVIIRHMVLPSNLENTYGVIDWVSEMFPHGEVLFSLMSQFTPYGGLEAYPEIDRRLTEDEYEKALDYMYLAGIDKGFVQELSSAKEEYTPSFDLSGV